MSMQLQSGSLSENDYRRDETSFSFDHSNPVLAILVLAYRSGLADCGFGSDCCEPPAAKKFSTLNGFCTILMLGRLFKKVLP